MPDINVSEIIEEIRALARENNAGGLSIILADLHPADIAEIMRRLPDEEMLFSFSLLTDELASETLAEMDEDLQEKILKKTTPERIADIIENLDSDDAADIVAELPDQVRREVLAEASGELQEDLKELLVYDEESAGGLMALELIALRANQPVIEAIQTIRREKDNVEDIYVIYVTDMFDKLVGFVTLKELVLSNPDDLLRDIMSEDILAVTPDVDQEEVVTLAKKYDLVSVPVVDQNYKLIGRITIDDIMDAMEEEASEDYNRMAGLTEDAQVDKTAWQNSLTRLPWLAIGLAGGIIAALVLSQFETSIEHVVALSFFVPVIMAMGGNSGIQSSSIVVRGLGTGALTIEDAWRKVSGELLTSIINGIVMGVALGIITAIWLDNMRFGIVLAFVLNLIIIQAGVFGAVIPFILKRLDIDPAIATGPFITTSNDVLGLIVYLSIVTYMM